MAQNREEARAEIEKLVRYFEQNIHQLKAPSFNEAQVRQQLIDPFFEALGWDVRNRQMLPPYRLEVIPEGRIKTTLGKGVREQTQLFDKHTGVKEEMAEYASMLEYIAEDEYKAEEKVASKKPDYRFRIQGSTKFFVEAKKPSVDLMSKVDAIFQIKRYGFSARVPVSILTDFEQFRVFDCTRKPFYDKPKLGVLKEFDLPYNAYLDEFDKLYDTFSREAAVAGSIEALQTKYLQKRTGEFALDRSFLEDLSEWRVELAQDIAKHPQNRRILNTYTLNECVQRILDRIVFLRVCEDRDIEEVGTLVALLRLWQDHPGLSLYDKFNELIKQRRSLYNGLLFTEHECERLVVSDKILEKIFKNINYPLSPYHFDEIGVEILGSIYERFLGRTIRLTQKQVRVEEKPEVRKAGGVYYTPQYIVNYIVENTLGRLLYGEPAVIASEVQKGRAKQSDPRKESQIASVAVLPRNDSEEKRLLLTPKQVSKLKIIDIACGSGSFLLGAFQKLIDYHIEWYTQHPEDIKEAHGVRDVYEDAQGQLRLSSRKKREILINNIYGVDIDPQAVEVTQMSLYLKVLEDENDATLNKPTMLALHEVLLPPLKNNIKCGNSLIGTDIGAQGELFDNEAMRKINPFNWEVEFTEVIKNGGFDCVVGNPPYVRPHKIPEEIKKLLWKSFTTFVAKSDLYSCFMERALTLTKPGGFLSYIVPHTWTSLESFTEIRQFLLSNSKISKLVQLPKRVFSEATVEACIFVVEKTKDKTSNTKNTVTVERLEPNGTIQKARKFLQKEIEEAYLHNFQLYGKNESQLIIDKVEKRGKPLSTLISFFYGFKTGDDEKFIHKTKKFKESKPFIRSADIDRYYHDRPREYVWYVPDEMTQHRKTARPGDKERFEAAKVTVARMGKALVASYDPGGLYVKDAMLLLQKSEHSLKYVLGLINSKLLNYYYREFFVTVDVLKNALLNLPICTIDFTNQTEKKVHDDLVALVDRMLDLHKQLHGKGGPHLKGGVHLFESEKEPIQRQIAATDKKIDEWVYKLYGLTEEEISIVEGKA